MSGDDPWYITLWFNHHRRDARRGGRLRCLNDLRVAGLQGAERLEAALRRRTTRLGLALIGAQPMADTVTAIDATCGKR